MEIQIEQFITATSSVVLLIFGRRFILQARIRGKRNG